jgi:hypothetical protein
LGSSQFTFPVGVGPDIDLIYNGCNLGFEARYFAVDQVSAAAGPTATGGPASILFAAPIAAASDTVTGTEYSQLWSLEFNVRKEVIPGALTFLAGYRHIELNERIFGTASLAGAATDTFSTEAFNRMDGFQLGGEAVLWRPGNGRFRLEADAKVGVFGDATSNFGTNSVGGGPNSVATATGTHTAFMSEWGITGVVQITPHLSGRVGYQGLLLDGVALASQQMGALNPLTGAATTVNTGTPIYHGAVADLEYCW